MKKWLLRILLAFALVVLAPILVFLAYLSFGGLCIQSPKEQELLSSVSPVFLESMKYEISPEKALASRNACHLTKRNSQFIEAFVVDCEILTDAGHHVYRTYFLTRCGGIVRKESIAI